MVTESGMTGRLPAIPSDKAGNEFKQGLTKREYMLAHIVPALIRATPNILWKNNGDTRNNMALFDLDDTAVEELILEAEDIVDKVLAK